MRELSYEAQLDVRVKQGIPLFGVSMKTVDDSRKRASPRRPSRPAGSWSRGPGSSNATTSTTTTRPTPNGWFDTGDIATIDAHGYMQITDRAKDLIKSGGEWISSVDLENTAMGHPQVALAAVIGVPHPKWQERPLLLIKPALGAVLTREQVLDFLCDKVARWWLPDDVVFVEEIPLTAAGKISKLTLRAGSRTTSCQPRHQTQADANRKDSGRQSRSNLSIPSMSTRSTPGATSDDRGSVS